MPEVVILFPGNPRAWMSNRLSGPFKLSSTAALKRQAEFSVPQFQKSVLRTGSSKKRCFLPTHRRSAAPWEAAAVRAVPTVAAEFRALPVAA